MLKKEENNGSKANSYSNFLNVPLLRFDLISYKGKSLFTSCCSLNDIPQNI